MVGLKLQILETLDESGILFLHLCNCTELILIEQMLKRFLLSRSEVAAVDKLVVYGGDVLCLQRVEHRSDTLKLIITIVLKILGQIIKQLNQITA